MYNLVCAMAGLGSRITQKYGVIKPLLPVLGKPMFEWVIDNIKCQDARFIFITQREHCQKYGLDEALEKKCKSINCECQVVQIDGLTDGCVRTILKAEHLIDNNDVLIQADVDQLIQNLDTKSLIEQMKLDNADGAIAVFHADNPKWSYVNIDKFGNICHVVEKQPISNIANAGVYAWMRGSDFVKAANDMIKADFRVNGELYLAPTFSFALKRGLIIKAYYYDKRAGLGSVDDVEAFPEIYKSWQ